MRLLRNNIILVKKPISIFCAGKYHISRSHICKIGCVFRRKFSDKISIKYLHHLRAKWLLHIPPPLTYRIYELWTQSCLFVSYDSQSKAFVISLHPIKRLIFVKKRQNALYMVVTAFCILFNSIYASDTLKPCEGFINLLKPSGNFTYQQVQQSIIPHSAQIAFMYFVHISEQTATFTVNISNSFVFYNRGWKCLLRGTHRVFI
jgi:hypothetical protein